MPSSYSQKRRSLSRTGLRLFVKKLRDLRKVLYQKILRKMTAGLSTLSRCGYVSEISVARSYTLKMFWITVMPSY